MPEVAGAGERAPVPTGAEAAALDWPLRAVLGPRWKQLLLLSLTSLAAGISEAAFLILVSQIALTLSSGDDTINLGSLAPMTVTNALITAFALVLFRVAFGLGAAWQSARLATSVTGEYRHRSRTHTCDRHGAPGMESAREDSRRS